MKKGLRLNQKDNVGVVLENVKCGDHVEFGGGLTIVAMQDIHTPHKMALANLQEGDLIIKYGEVMGYATQCIKAGDFVHDHNCDSEKMMR